MIVINLGIWSWFYFKIVSTYVGWFFRYLLVLHLVLYAFNQQVSKN